MMLDKTRWSVGVIVPACDEEDTIEHCIESILASLTVAEVGSSWIVVVADSCTDRTTERAKRALGGRGEVIMVKTRSAGAARRVGVARVVRRFAHIDPARLWLANTDADTYVSEEWISVQLSLADEGVTGVAGIVKLDAVGCAEAHQVYEKTYLTQPEGTHTHVHGANLAVRADAYEDVGGWSNLALAEDHCLWTRLKRAGWRLISPVASVVTTSPRLSGRASGGFADTLRSCVEKLNAGSQETA